MNLCRSCNEDFGSVTAFDLHRVGTHVYTYSEGLQMNPPREDGRRCLSTREIERLKSPRGTAVFAPNQKGRWSVAGTLNVGKRLRGAA